MTLLIIFLGFLFGAILNYARLNRFDTISGMAMLKDLTVAKAIAMAIGAGIILISIEVGLGWATMHVKPFMVGGIILGGLIFGAGMAILGYCPGTLAVSLGEGSLDALTGIIGGLVGGLVYTLALPSIQGLLGPDLGPGSLHLTLGHHPFLFYFLSYIAAIVFMGIALWLNKYEKSTDRKWLYAGLGLAALNGIIFLKAGTNRIIGASTFYPWAADLLTGTTTNDYFTKIKVPGHWEFLFLAGAFAAGLVLSLVRKDFKIRLIHDNWEKYKGSSTAGRIIWSFIGGFILIFGARMAGGCTSGHILSGGMQLAYSSLVFAVFVFAGLLLTGRFFYRQTR
jgi:uncharacterized membrane protein YedE/YeeE